MFLQFRVKALLLLLLVLCIAATLNGNNAISCCRKLQSGNFREVLQCTNESSAHSYVKGLSEPIYQPALTVTLLSRVTPEVSVYGAYSYLVQSLYAQHNGYTLLPLWKDSSRDDYLYHRKLVPIIDTLSSDDVFSDYVAWIDADLIPLDLDFRVEKIAAQYPRAHILLSEDVSSVANTGFIIVKGNSRWAQQFLEDWLAQMTKPGIETEQLGFEAIYRSRSFAEMQSKVAILPAHVLNSVATAMGQQLSHHQILHLAAESSSLRSAVFKKAAANLCAALTTNQKPPHQLGISRKFLQDTAKQIYGTDFQRLEEQIVLYPATVTMSEFAEYRTSASKYCFAENYANNFTETPSILDLRTRAHIIASNFTLTRLRDLALHATNYTIMHAESGWDDTELKHLFNALTREEVISWASHEDLIGYTDAMRGAMEALASPIVNTVQAFAARVRPLLTQLLLRQCALPVHDPSAVAGQHALAQTPLCQDLASYRFWQELPETIKLSAEISHDLLVAILSAPVSDLPRPNLFSPIAEEIYTVHPHRDPRLVGNLLNNIEFNLKLLRKIVHPSQLSVIDSMVKDMDSLVPKIKALIW